MQNPVKSDTRIKHTYLMKSNWDYITFKAYNPDDRQKLSEYLNNYCENGKKSFIFINNIDDGKVLQEKLKGSQHIYSDDDKRSELHEIAVNEKFVSDSLITTKVAENGLSLHDDTLFVIVAETYDLTVLQQVIGRARVNRRNPREIIVLIPDYSLSQLGSIEGKLYMQLTEFQKVMDNPEFAMQYLPQPNPYIYYDAILKRFIVNRIGYQQIQTQFEYISALKEEEQDRPHAHICKVLELYGKHADNIEELFIDYDNTKDCKMRIESSWHEYMISDRDEQALKVLKEEIKSACNETRAYPKTLDSNIQISTVNEILKFAGIKYQLNPKRIVFEFSETEG